MEIDLCTYREHPLTKFTCRFCCGEWEQLDYPHDLECPHCGCGEVQDYEVMDPVIELTCQTCRETWQTQGSLYDLECPHCESGNVHRWAWIVPDLVVVPAMQLELELTSCAAV